MRVLKHKTEMNETEYSACVVCGVVISSVLLLSGTDKQPCIFSPGFEVNVKFIFISSIR